MDQLTQLHLYSPAAIAGNNHRLINCGAQTVNYKIWRLFEKVGIVGGIAGFVNCFEIVENPSGCTGPFGCNFALQPFSSSSGGQWTGDFLSANAPGLDYLCNHPHVDVDRNRIGVTGLSGGGWQTIVLSVDFSESPVAAGAVEKWESRGVCRISKGVLSWPASGFDFGAGRRYRPVPPDPAIHGQRTSSAKPSVIWGKPLRLLSTVTSPERSWAERPEERYWCP